MARQDESRVLFQIVEWGYRPPSFTQTMVVLVLLCVFAQAAESLGSSRIVVLVGVVLLILPITLTINFFVARTAMPEAPISSGLSAPLPPVGRDEEQKERSKTMAAGQGQG